MNILLQEKTLDNNREHTNISLFFVSFSISFPTETKVLAWISSQIPLSLFKHTKPVGGGGGKGDRGAGEKGA